MSEHELSASAVIFLDDAEIEAIANRAAEIAAEKIAEAESKSRYLTTLEASEYLRCSRQRLYDLVSARVLSPYKDGRKSLYLRDDLDRYLEEGREP